MYSWVPGPHQVVEYHACCDNKFHRFRLLWHSAKEKLELIDQYAERFFYNTPSTGQPVFKDALCQCHTPQAVRFHQVGS